MQTAELICPECSAPMLLRKSRFGLFYGCSRYPACRAAHGAHPDGRPLGIPADKETKQARIRAHAVFDRLWQYGKMTRKQAYRHMRKVMNMTADEAHIGRFTKAQCEELIGKLHGDDRPPTNLEEQLAREDAATGGRVADRPPRGFDGAGLECEVDDDRWKFE